MEEGALSQGDGLESWARSGEILDGKFRLGEILGRGGMGVVVAAHHLDLDEPVALKFLLPDAGANPAATERLLREARATARLKSAHVTRIFDVGRTSGLLPYIVMERLRGDDLWSLLRSRGSLPVAEAVGYMLQVCEPLEEAHALGIIHRDLKPQNIFLARVDGGRSIVKLLDFGISRAASVEYDLTRANEFLGTPHFMSPEQYRDPRAAGPPSDIYSLGACLYCLLTSRPPFLGGDLIALCANVLEKSHTPLRTLRSDVPEELAAVVDRCLAKDPRDRFASAAALREALAPFGVAGPSPRAGHVDDETILAMQEGRLGHDALRSAEAHLAQCTECRTLVAAASPSMARSVDGSLPSTLPSPHRAEALPATARDETLASAFAASRRAVASPAARSHDPAPQPATAAAADMATLASADHALVLAQRTPEPIGGTLTAAGVRVFDSPPAASARNEPARGTLLAAIVIAIVLAAITFGGARALRKSDEPAAATAPPFASPPASLEIAPTPLPAAASSSPPSAAAAAAPAADPAAAPPRGSAARASGPARNAKRAAVPAVTAASPKPGEIPNER